MTTYIAQSVWTPYEQGNKPIVPEPAMTGLLILTMAITFIFYRRRK